MATIIENNGDASADNETLYTITLGDVFQGTLDPADDKDLVRVELTAGTVYDITLSDVDSAELALFDSAGNLIVTGGEVPSGAKFIFSPTATGTYYIHAGSRDSDFTGSYELSLVENTIPEGTYDEIADYLTDGYWQWQGGTRAAFNVGPGGVLTANISALTEEGQQLARWAFEAWTNVTGIRFEFVEADHADIIFTNKAAGTAATGGPVAQRHGLIISSGVNIPTDYLIKYGSTIGSDSFQDFIHEIGHALGLGHPGPYNAVLFYYGLDNIFLNDSDQATVMSYFDQAANTYINASRANVITPMIADIIAIQNLYGIPDNINTDDTIYGYNSNLDGYLGEFFRLLTGEANPFINIDMTADAGTPTIKLRLVDIEGDGDPDLVVGNNTGLLHYFENTGTSSSPDFTERTGTDNPLDGISVGSYSTPTFADLDGDGDPDLIVGNGNGAVAYFENTGTVTAPSFTQRTGATNPFDNITMGSWSTLALADLDGDGDLDLSVGTDDGDVRYYENTGTSADPAFVLHTGDDSPFNNINADSYSTPVFVDIDNDNDYDLVVGNGFEGVYYFENTGTATSPDFTQRNGFDNPFLGTDAGFFIAPDFVDLNGDGNLDLITGNQAGIITYFKNTGTQANPEFSPQSLVNPSTFTIYDNGGNDTLDLRTDTYDQRVYLRAEGISDVYGLTGNLIIARDTLIENYIAGSGNDLVVGNAVANYINGRDGDDRIWGSGGDDILEGGAGADRLDGDAGMDWVSYRDSDAAVTVNLVENTVDGGHAEGDVIIDIEGAIGSGYEDVLQGNDGDNRLEGGPGADRLDGGGGTDWVSYRGSDAGVTVDLRDHTVSGGHAEGDVISSFENVTGSGFRDVLTGNDSANRLVGGDGADELRGNGGEDVLEGSASADRLDGGTGRDWASYQGSDTGVTVNLMNGTGENGHSEGDVFVSIENLSGSAYGDILVGDDDVNHLEGEGGADELRGNGGDDVLDGGVGADELDGGNDNDQLLGNEGDDILEGGAGADRLDGGIGMDWASYQGSDTGVTVNLMDGTGENGHAQGDVFVSIENLRGSAYGDILVGDDNANFLEGGAGEDTLEGGNDNDELWGNEGDDILKGSAGSDSLYGDAGADELDGGSGIDWIIYRESGAGVTVDLTDGTGEGGYAQGDTITNVENITGTGYADVLRGDGSANVLQGLDGNDELRGNGGNDVLEGGAGADRLDGDTGIDQVSYQDSDTGVTVDLVEGVGEGGHAEGDVLTGIENVIGSDYDDFLRGDAGGNKLEGGYGWDFLLGGGGADRLDGGDGIDWIFYDFSDAGVTVDLEEGTGKGGHAEGDVIVDVENVGGSDYPDVLIGDDGDNALVGAAGADRLDGGDGIDWIFYDFSDTGVTVDLEEGTGQGGHAEGDVIVDVEDIRGSDYADVLIGDNGSNYLDGLDGNDELRGNGGDDWLYGNAGDDRLEGGGGADRLYGNEGDDTFIFGAGHGDDRILDFTSGEDQIDLSAFGLSGFEELTISSISDSLEIDLSGHGGGTILLQNFDMADLDMNDFLF